MNFEMMKILVSNRLICSNYTVYIPLLILLASTIIHINIILRLTIIPVILQ